MKVGCIGWAHWLVLVVGLAGCHGKETDEVIAGLRGENERLRSDIAAARAENLVLIESVDPRWPSTVSLKRAGGGTSRLMYRRECPQGQALKGFSARAGSVVDALVPLCAPVAKMPGTSGTRTLERELAIVGGRGGKSVDSMCPGQGLMIGLRGRSAEVIDALESVCEDNKSGTRVGGEGGREYERMCPVGWLAVGITGRQGDYLESVSLTCADAGELRGATREKPGFIKPSQPETPGAPGAAAPLPAEPPVVAPAVSPSAPAAGPPKVPKPSELPLTTPRPPKRHPPRGGPTF